MWTIVIIAGAILGVAAMYVASPLIAAVILSLM